jgi:hypothetical protein
VAEAFGEWDSNFEEFHVPPPQYLRYTAQTTSSSSQPSPNKKKTGHYSTSIFNVLFTSNEVVMVSVDVNGSTSQSTVQLIDEDCNFKYSQNILGINFVSEKIGEYIRDTKLEGFGYHLVAVFGSQSTGKSRVSVVL